jgi:hypothetical protein
MKKIITLASLLIVALQSQAMEWPDGQITFHVMDESGKSLANIPIDTVVLDQSKPPATYKVITSTTDAQGLAVVNTPNITKEYSYTVKNVAGYYSSGGLYKFDTSTNGQWLPWNPTIEIVLKPIDAQVPMYAKKVWNTSLPENNKPIGYDLEIGDWVAPYGKGVTPDFIFTLERKFTSVTQDFNATLTLTFPNDGDGIQSVMSDSSGSSLRTPRFAPENDYEPKLVLQMYREDGKPMVGVSANPDQNYFFRVRTKKDDWGNIVSTMYGKIYDGMGWDIFHSPTAKLRFAYYLNPALNSRNMEFDSKQNLFKNLKSFERANAP